MTCDRVSIGEGTAAPIGAGTSVLRDFVELPSQLFEHFLSAPEATLAAAHSIYCPSHSSSSSSFVSLSTISTISIISIVSIISIISGLKHDERHGTTGAQGPCQARGHGAADPRRAPREAPRRKDVQRRFAPRTSAHRAGSDWLSSLLPHLRHDWAHPSHICAATGRLRRDRVHVKRSPRPGAARAPR